MYACGLRIGEAATVEIASVDRASLLLRIIGKGDKERRVPLPQPMLDDLRRLWLTHRNQRWLCPDRLRTGPVSKNALWRTFRLSVRAAGITRPVSPHALRHSYANSTSGKRRRYEGRANPARPRQHRDDRHLYAPDRADPGIAQKHPR